MMAKKIGLFEVKDSDRELLQRLFQILEKNKLDFTNSFRNLNDLPDSSFLEDWKQRLQEQDQGQKEIIDLMNSVNPWIIPRNHQVEKAIQEANHGDYTCFNLLTKAYQKPYEVIDEYRFLTAPPEDSEVVKRTFCGT